ncbi:MAG: hypothetical protein AB8B97_18035 [Granulosicoccus sp.]
MLQIFKTIAERHNSYMTFMGRKRACEVLLSSSDRMLEDAGFSRALLEKGVDGWPWLISEDERTMAPLDLSTLSARSAIKELQAYSEAELHDLGITRGTIVEAVLHGRDDQERNSEQKAA